ncbi:lipoprotein insertase outer membrane protein LolB [Paraburkholderia antibiotica]|uniref:Outer-membrane lipoprotein LolB n=1 Tax=Paraburkholderia antibiotica TaxID=2728839 RepID=A0A7X9X948_9BURK|nr:lipoprotein insertase outer membrane protein LolB [Paraburkholderia antibiotica]NML33177.1 lipoprotein localization protein LolB [Paraburkholderia antibiotica]
MRLSRLISFSQAPRGMALGFAAAAVVALAGCASVKPQGPSMSNAATAVTAQTARSYQGRFAVQYSDQYGHQQNAYGNFSWQETGDTVTLQLRNPLGQTMAIVTSSPASATLELPNRAPLTADNVSTLMQNALGFALPVEGLRYWLQPSPAPTSRAHTEKDPEQPSRLKQITQDGWTIDYLAYADAPATGIKRVNLSRTEPPLDIKLVLDQ